MLTSTTVSEYILRLYRSIFLSTACIPCYYDISVYRSSSIQFENTGSKGGRADDCRELGILS